MQSEIPELSLWGKKSSHGEPKWLPLVVHLADTAEVGKQLWDEWLCDGAKRNIADNCTFTDSLDDAEKLRQARSLFVFLCAAHDLGKATPGFQTKEARPCYAGLSDQGERNERAYKCCDLDKAIQQKLESAGFFCPDIIPERMQTPHAMCSQVILMQQAGKSVNNIAAILGAHHGKPQRKDIKASLLESYPLNFYGGKEGKALWIRTQNALLQWALNEAGFKSLSDAPSPNLVASVELSGLLVMADWISSNEWLFPYIFIDDIVEISNSIRRARHAYSLLALTHPWEPLYDSCFTRDLNDYYLRRFSFSNPNRLQQRTIEIVQSLRKPGIIVVEAPMGYGKTETALAAAEILAKNTGRTGVFFALPTQATSNGIFPRLLSWISHFDDSRCHSVKLFHSHAEFNDDWKKLQNEEDRQRDAMTKDCMGNGEESDDDTIIVNDWFSGRKKSMLADFVVGTIDQLLMGAFKHKHLMLRHLGLANKVIIIDECHAYDAYMSVYLERILEWLGKYQIPTIVLSATLPSSKRSSIMNAYTNHILQNSPRNAEESLFFDFDESGASPTPAWMTTREYPIVTYSDGENVSFDVISRDEIRHIVHIDRIEDDNISNSLAQLLDNGGCAGIIVNSVTRAQTLYGELSDRFGSDKVLLFHSRFLMPDRTQIEKKVTRMLGKPGNNTHRPDFQIIIGTQVLEQSLDIDFDVLYTDIAPMDLLIQRIGRLHRHERNRPARLSSPVCYVMGIQKDNTFQRASVAVYGNYLLMRTLALLPETIVLPDDISQLVDDVYNEHCQIAGISQERYEEATRQYHHIIDGKEGRAKAFRLGNANTSKRFSLNGWLDCDGGDIQERAAVRDIQESIEVIFVQELTDGYIHLLDEKQTTVSRNEIPSDDLAREILQYSLELPLGVIHHFDDTISILEKHCENLAIWQKSRWLKGCLILILDENGHFNGLPGFVLMYSKAEGLSYRKEQTNA